MQPPQNPYNQPGSGQQPQQPFSPQQPYAPVPQGPRGTVSLDVIGEAWNLVKPSLGQWVIAMLIAGAGFFLVSLVSNLIQRPFLPTGTGTGAGGAPSIGAGFYLALIVAQVFSFVVNSILVAGLIRMAISHVRTGVANINEMFGVTSVIGPVLLGALLTGIITYVGILFCIIPGIIAALGLAMTQPLIVDQQMSPVDAMKRSWEAMKPHLGSFFVLGFVLGLLNMAGALACLVGLFVTYPISIVAIALVYRDLFGGASNTNPTLGYTPPPIANPNF